jgi:hypothetical protein
MAEIKAPLPESSPPRRPWHRLHLSTWLVLIFTLGILILLIVPGEIPGDSSGQFLPYNPIPQISAPFIFQHGWPWAYLEQGVADPDFSIPIWGEVENFDYPPWFYVCGWSLTGEDTNFSPIILLLDIIFAASILFLVAISFEWRRRRIVRIWQFTLRELLLVMILLAVLLSWWRTNHVRLQKEKEILHFSEQVLYNSFWEYRGPDFLEKLLGKEFLSDLYTITNFSLSNKINNHISIPKLDSSISSSLPYIKLLVAEETTHADIEDISNLRHLESLVLVNTIVTEADLSLISRISSLERVFLSKTPITSKGILSLQSLPRLEELFLDDAEIGDESARALASLDNLQYLYIRESQISDNSVSCLANLTRLKELHIQKTDITPKGCGRLQMLLPRCKVIYESDKNPVISFPPGSGMF